MSRFIVQLLGAINILLAVALASLWLDREGQLRNTRWTPPLPVKADLGVPPAQDSLETEGDISRFIAILDRPLFSPSRRQPPPPPPPAPPPPPDPFADFELFGVFAGQGSNGIMARVGGKARRIQINEQVEGWTLKTIDDRNVTFANGDQSRTLRLVARKVAAPPKPAPTNTGAGATANAPGTSYNTQLKQQVEEEARERIRYLNQVRAKAGLPPLPQ